MTKPLNKRQQRLVESHVKFAYYIGNKLRKAKWLPAVLLDKDELDSACLFGLVRAASMYDAKRGIAFTTYAMYAIRSAVASSAINAQVVRFPTTQFDGRDYNQAVRSITATDVGDDFDLEKFPTNHNQGECETETSDENEYLARLLSLLDDRSIWVLRQIYHHQVSMRELGKLMDLSHEGVRQIKQRAIREIQRYIDGSDTENQGTDDAE